MTRLLLVLALAVSAACPALAQNSISYGSTRSDYLQQGARDRWSFYGSAGDVVTIQMNASFDTVLELYTPNGSQLSYDDDGGDGLNSLINSVRLPTSGTYSIAARSIADTYAGSYTVSLDRVGSDGGGNGDGNGDGGSTAGGSISYGGSRTGYLYRGDRSRWTFYGSPGDVVTIDMSSSDFDSYLELLSPNGSQATYNDDGGGSLNSRISSFRLSNSGTYTIIARALGDGGTGSYALSLSRDYNGGNTGNGGGSGNGNGNGGANQGSISFGSSRTGYASSGSRNRWTFYASAGDRATIDLIASGSGFDTYLELVGLDGTTLTTDDDGGDGLNSRITGYYLSRSGTYTIVARPYSGSGSYTLYLNR